jgi:hypothetical protein
MEIASESRFAVIPEILCYGIRALCIKARSPLMAFAWYVLRAFFRRISLKFSDLSGHLCVLFAEISSFCCSATEEAEGLQ